MTPPARVSLWAALFLPWLLIWQGLDFSDQGYLLSGYRCFFRHPEVTEDSGHMWLTNLVGATWDALFGGLGVVGMRALWALCMSLGLLLSFRIVRSVTSAGPAAFSVLVASAFLVDRRETWFSYNTLSSLAFVAASACLLRGILGSSWRWLFAAGVVIGLGPFARFPNLLAGALLSAIMLAAWLEPERRKRLLRDLGAALLGTASGVVVMLALIYARGDWALYVGGVRSLFAPSMQNAGYSGDSLIGSFAADQTKALAFGLAICAFGLGLARLLHATPSKLRWARWAMVAVAGGLGVYGLAREGEPWRWVVPGTTYFVLVALTLGVGRPTLGLRLGAWIALIVVVIAPLGSNNGIKNAHMGLWLGLPIMLAAIQTWQAKLLVEQARLLAVVAAIALSGEALYRARTYTYRDAARAELRHSVDHPQLRGQFTTRARAKSVSEVLSALEERVEPGDYLLAYEGTPLLQYLTKTRPYLNRPWLMGWERPEVVKGLVRAALPRTGCLPVAVVTTGTTRTFGWPRGKRRLEKRSAQRGVRKVLKRFLETNGYARTWDNGFFEIYEPPPEKTRHCSGLVPGKARH